MLDYFGGRILPGLIVASGNTKYFIDQIMALFMQYSQRVRPYSSGISSCKIHQFEVTDQNSKKKTLQQMIAPSPGPAYITYFPG